MKILLILTFMVLLLSLSSPARAELVVVVHPANPVNELKREQVVDIFMGRKQNFPAGSAALPIDLAADSPLRSAYYRDLVGKTVPQVNAYWARLLFTGRATPPRVMPDAQAVLKSVRENRDAIAYLDSKDVDGKVKVVYQLK